MAAGHDAQAAGERVEELLAEQRFDPRPHYLRIMARGHLPSQPCRW